MSRLTMEATAADAPAPPADARFVELYSLRRAIHEFVRRQGIDRWTTEDIVSETYVVA